MKIYFMMGSVAYLLVILSFASGKSTLSVENRLIILEDKLVERDGEIQRLGNTVEAISQQLTSLTSKWEIISDEGSNNNVTMDIEDTISSVRQNSPARASLEVVAFYAYLSKSRCYNDWETVVFDTEVTDIGGSYNSYNGTLSIPVTGTYVLTVTVVPNLYRWINLEIVSNGKVLGVVLGDSEGSNSHTSGSIAIAVHFQLGEHVLVRKKESSGSCAIYSGSAAYTSFAGWLIG